jgi:hypothetical protein
MNSEGLMSDMLAMRDSSAEIMPPLHLSGRLLKGPITRIKRFFKLGTQEARATLISKLWQTHSAHVYRQIILPTQQSQNASA